MDSSPLLLPLLIATSAIGGAIFMAVNLRKARALEDTPRAKIRSAAQGYTGLSGFARALENGESLTAPLTGHPCLWYHYIIEQRGNNRGGSSWEKVESGSSDRFFVLDDRTGTCNVDPRGADVTAAIRQRWEGNERHPTAPRKGSLLRSLFSQHYRYTEFRIHADEWVHVLGWFETLRPRSQAELTAEETKRILNEWKLDRDALLVRFDRNRDGEIDLDEWERVRSAAAYQAAKVVAEQPAFRPIDTISRSPLRDQPYLIATKEPREVAGRYRRIAVLSLLFGCGLAGYLAWRGYFP